MSQYFNFNELISAQHEESRTKEPFSRDVRDGFEQLLDIVNIGNGISNILKVFTVDQLNSIVDYCEKRVEQSETLGKIRLYQVKLPGEASNVVFLDRKKANALILKEGLRFADSDRFSSHYRGLGITTFFETKEDAWALLSKAEREDLDIENQLTVKDSDPIVFKPTKHSETLWDAVGDKIRKEIQVQVEHIKGLLERYKETEHENLERISSLQKGHEIFLEYMKNNSLQDKWCKSYCDHLDFEQLKVAIESAKHWLKVKQSAGKINLYILSYGRNAPTYYVEEKEARLSYISAVKKLSTLDTGSFDMEVYVDEFFLEDVPELSGVSEEWLADFVRKNPERLLSTSE
jgi:hypothetical protein